MNHALHRNSSSTGSSTSASTAAPKTPEDLRAGESFWFAKSASMQGSGAKASMLMRSHIPTAPSISRHDATGSTLMGSALSDSEDEEAGSATRSAEASTSTTSPRRSDSTNKSSATRIALNGDADSAVRGLTRRGRPRKLFRYLKDLGEVPGVDLRPVPAYDPKDGSSVPCSPPKRGASLVDDGNGLKRRRIKKVAKACVFCKRSHMTCDDERPCRRCHKRGIAHMCADEEPIATAAAIAGPSSPPANVEEHSKKTLRGRKRRCSASNATNGEPQSTAELKRTSRRKTLEPIPSRPASPVSSQVGPENSDSSKSETLKIPPSAVLMAALTRDTPNEDEAYFGSVDLAHLAKTSSAASCSQISSHGARDVSSSSNVERLAASDPAPLLSLDQLSSPNGQLQIPTGELFWAAFPQTSGTSASGLVAGSGLTPGQFGFGVGSGLTPFETFRISDGSLQNVPTFTQLDGSTSKTASRGLESGREASNAEAIGPSIASTASADAGATLAAFGTGLQQYAALKKPFTLSIPSTVTAKASVSQAELADGEAKEYEHLKARIASALTSDQHHAWSPALEGKMARALESLRGAISAKMMGLNELEKQRLSIDFARVHAHYKHAVLESVSAPMLLLTRWGRVCDINSHLVDLLRLDACQFDLSMVGMEDFLCPGLAVHLFEHCATVLQSPKTNEAIRATGDIVSPAARKYALDKSRLPRNTPAPTMTGRARTADEDAALARLVGGVTCVISFQLVCSAHGVPLMGVATLLPIEGRIS
ncbi:potential fungal zinc cluster transcription factor [Ceraceosorus bombacis]|uniref:Potential fungal zinc cluster transcription factor n=1 Tax=Ceraceosorus bombacis TaxID=401625 RepID=A0A0P1BB63_9BASI|nr:potential fungal zinc cluster transcription factor [Ceraceosorus bombacis]